MSPRKPPVLVPWIIPAIIAAVGGSVAACRLFGLDWWPVLSVWRDWQAMSFSTGVCFIGVAAVLWLVGRHNGLGQRACKVASAFVLLAMGWQLAGHAFGFRAGLESLSVPLRKDNPGPAMGTMFAFIGAALWGLLRDTRWAAGDRFTGTGVSIIGGMGLVGYAINVEAFKLAAEGGPGMAFHTSAMFLLTGLGILSVARPGHPADKPARIAVSMLLIVAVSLAIVSLRRALGPAVIDHSDSIYLHSPGATK